jgi:N-methylhydantoinase B/oxoprolinase/acetone carboxylase alpha subunit
MIPVQETARPGGVDPFTAEIIRSHLIATVREMVATTVRTAYSTCFSEGEDFTCALFDAAGNMIAQAAGNLCHTGLTVAVRHILSVQDDFQPGDVVIHNDPYTGCSHQADVTVCRPIFYRDVLVGFAVNRGHWTDVGGMAPGGWSGTARHVNQEGLIIPAVKLYRRGQLDRGLQEILLKNVRVSHQAWGDLQSQIASNITAERRTGALIEKYGLALVLAGFDAAREYSRRRFLKAMAAVPNGTASAHEIYMEDDGFGGGPYRVRVTLTKTPERIVVDYAGTDRQALATVNCSQSVARAATYSPIIAIVDPEVPFNQGVVDLIEYRAPAGCLINPTYPAPCFASTADPGARISEIIQVAFSQLLPERVIASSYATGNNLTAWGFQPDGQDEFLYYVYQSGGCGARATRDGNSAEWHLMANSKNESMEVWEQRYPVRFERFELVEDSAGPGRWRGGLGVTRQFELLVPTVLTANADRHTLPPPGYFGGGDGSPNRFSIKRDGQDRRFDEWFGTPSRGKFSNIAARPGDVLCVTEAGGAGYGDPFERDPELVAADVRDGYVSPASALADYGVVLDRRLDVDAAATEVERSRRRSAG